MIDFSDLTINNQGFEALSEIAFARIYDFRDFQKFVTLKKGLRNGKPVGLVYPFKNVGKPKHAGCGGTYEGGDITATQKVWEINEYEILNYVCYADLEQYFLKFEIERNTDGGDLTAHKIVVQVVMPAFEDAIERMMWRMIWFGDKAAKNVTDGGIITDGLDVDYFKNNDGLFKKIFAIGAAKPEQLVEIAANAEATKAAQRAAIRVSGVATGIFDNLIDNMPVEIVADAEIMCTRELGLALDYDIRKNNKGSDLQWKAIGSGRKETMYNGTKITMLPEWDLSIKEYENLGAKLNMPFRAVCAPKSNLQAGTEAKNKFNKFRIYFNEEDEQTKFKLYDTIGTEIAQDNLLIYAA